MLAAAAAIIGSPLAWAKLRGERTNIWINAAKGAVVIQSDVIDDLRDQLDELRTQITEIRDLRIEVATLTDKLQATKIQRDRLALENAQLRQRVEHLEQVVRDNGLDGTN